MHCGAEVTESSTNKQHHLSWSNGALWTRQCSTRDFANLHPCRQAAYFLPCARPPDACGFFLARPRLRLAQGSRDRAEARAFAVTRSGTDTMPRRGDDDDLEEDTRALALARAHTHI